MKRGCFLRLATLYATLIFAAPASHALGMGTMEGVPLIGRPLDVAVLLSPDPGTDLANACARADVIQGDTPIDGVITQVEGIGTARPMLRVRTRRLIDEPVVTVTVHVGCFLKTTRRFVLLSDLPANAPEFASLQLSQQLPSVPAMARPAARPAATQAPGPAVRRRAAREVPASTGTAPPRAVAPSMSPRTVAAAGAASPQPKAAPAAQRRAAAPESRPPPSVVRVQPRSRLKLDPVDAFAPDPEPKLRLAMTMDNVPEVSPQRRAEASAVWKALNRSPVDVMQDYERMQAMSADLTTMRQHILSNKADLDAMRLQLANSQAERDRITWILSTLVLGLVLALAAALLYRRRERAPKPEGADTGWWRDSRTADVAPSAGKAAPPRDIPGPGEARDLDVDLSIFGPAEEPPSTPPNSRPISAFSHLDFQNSQPASWKSLTSEELHDIQEQADFFVSLGDYDRAVNVLMSHVHASPQTSALAWMALLDLHHQLNRRQGYEGLRDQIERRMNVKVPEFDHYQEPTAGLESYADALARIVSLWPSPRVLDVIEESIYRLPGSMQTEPFELAAFDELLLLNNIGKEVVAETEAPDIDLDAEAGDSLSSEEFPMTSIVPLSAELAGPSDEDMLVLASLLAGSRIDIDLDEADATLPNGKPAAAASAAQKAADNLIEFDNAFDSATARLGKT